MIKVPAALYNFRTMDYSQYYLLRPRTVKSKVLLGHENFEGQVLSKELQAY